ncbi:MAG: substrate-binding domain-containing protein [Xanthomonadales bacterium]|nr:LacI family transcriptional regulator [Xanthomonadales bacterium]NIX13000.1 substrate-binding domain-containing protein [Xanthomonadales bacterium]
MTRKPTINDVAERAGVSKRTVSRVINQSPKVNERTRARVQKVIEELNFAPNRQARGLAARRSFLVGLVYDVPTLFINDIQKSILGVIEDAGYELVVHACDYPAEGLVENITRFVNRAHLDGVIILPPVSDIEGIGERLRAAGCRYVRITSEISDEMQRLVVTNYLPAIADMVGYLVELGHREFGHISGPYSHLSARKRQECFVQALSDHGIELDPGMVIEGAYTYDSGLKAARELLSRDNRPTVIFSGNDEMAFGVINVAHELGLRIPEDLSLVSFDGTPFSVFAVPSLSTIIRPADEMAQLATQKMLAQFDAEDSGEVFETMIRPWFEPRESTGPVPD